MNTKLLRAARFGLVAASVVALAFCYIVFLSYLAHIGAVIFAGILTFITLVVVLSFFAYYLG